MPGFTNLQGITGELVVTSVFVDMRSYSSLRCWPNIFSINGNGNMTSLDGLKNLAVPIATTTAPLGMASLRIYDNPLLKTAGAFAPLALLLGCVGTGANSTGLAYIRDLSVQVADCPPAVANIGSVDQLCKFVTSPANTACPSGP